VPDRTDALASLPADARTRLDAFFDALGQINVGDMTIYAASPIQPGHDLAVRTAESAADGLGLEAAVAATKEAAADYVARAYQNAMMRISYMGTMTATGFGEAADQVRVMRSLQDAVTALVLWEALDEGSRDELLGPWVALVD
jgi:hypothetical protein